MPQIYITVAERYFRSFLPSGRFEVEHRELYDGRVTPAMARTLIKEYGADDAIGLLEYVIEHVEARRERARNSLNRYALKCYVAWLRDVTARVDSGRRIRGAPGDQMAN